MLRTLTPLPWIGTSRAACPALCAASIFANAALTVAVSRLRPMASAATSFALPAARCSWVARDHGTTFGYEAGRILGGR